MVAGHDKDGEPGFLGRPQLFGQRLVPVDFAAVDEIPGQQQDLRPLLPRVPQKGVDELQIIGRGRGRAALVRVVGIEVQIRRRRDAKARRRGERRIVRHSDLRGAAAGEQQREKDAQDPDASFHACPPHHRSSAA